jgi:ABC-type branched-subunit amino acid transport system ATPase component
VFGGLVAVNDVSFDIQAGQIVGLIGPNGAGKSTTFNLITGILRLSGGEVSYAGERLSALDPRRVAERGIARTFQHAKVLPGMSVLENVALGAHLRGTAGVFRSFFRLDRKEEKALLAEAARQIDRVGLSAHRDRPAGDLALGQIRILEIARALCLNPTLLLLDEPAAGLRHGEKQELANLLRKLKAEGVSVLLVEHDMGFVMGLVDHLVVLDFGTLIAEGKPVDVRRHPAVIAAYLGSAA